MSLEFDYRKVCSILISSLDLVTLSVLSSFNFYETVISFLQLQCRDLMLFLDHDDFNLLSSSTISFLWRIIGDVLFFYFNSSVISLIKKVRNFNRMGCSKGQIHKKGTQKSTLDFLFMFSVKSSNSTFKIFIFIDVDHVCRHSTHLLYKRKPKYTLGSSLINSSRRIRYTILGQFNFVFQWGDSIYRTINGLIYS